MQTSCIEIRDNTFNFSNIPFQKTNFQPKNPKITMRINTTGITYRMSTRSVLPIA